MASVVISGDTSGAVTITAPAVAGTPTLTLPTTTDTLIGRATTDTLTNKTLVAPALGTPSALVLTNATGLPRAALPTGSVVQVVSANTTTTTSTSSTSFVATSLAATITPISASNKILILVAGGVIRAGSGNQIYMTVYRGATNLGHASRGLSQMNGNASNDYTPALSYYDGPATTSSTTYTVYVATASSTVGFELDTVPCTMTLMEIAG